MKILISPRAEKELRKLAKIDQIAVAKKIRQLKNSPQIINEQKLQGFLDIFRTRIGDLRIIYKKTSVEIYIILIGHRRDIYQLLRRLI